MVLLLLRLAVARWWWSIGVEEVVDVGEGFTRAEAWEEVEGAAGCSDWKENAWSSWWRVGWRWSEEEGGEDDGDGVLLSWRW